MSEDSQIFSTQPKTYREIAAIPLAHDLSLPAANTLNVLGKADSNEDRGIDLHILGQILYFASRIPIPVETYLVSTDISGLAAGVYHFHPAEIALRRLRSGDFRPELGGAAGDNQAIAGAPVTLVLSAPFQRCRPGSEIHCYRESVLHCGAELANTLAITAAYEIPCSVELGFVDAKVNQVLGIDGKREVALCLAPIGRSFEWALHGGSEIVAPLNDEFARPSSPVSDLRGWGSTHAATCLTSEAEVRPWRGPCPGQNREPNHATVSLPSALQNSMPLGEVFAADGAEREFGVKTLSLDDLSSVLEHSTRDIPADFLEGPETSLLEIYLWIREVSGLEAGPYAFHPGNLELAPLLAGGPRDRAEIPSGIDEACLRAGALAFFFWDPSRITARFAKRGLRAALLEAGITIRKFVLAARSISLEAKRVNFDESEAMKMFSPRAEGQEAITAVAIGGV